MLRAVRGPLLILVLIALLLVGLWFWVRTSLPELQGSVSLPGLARSVEIRRDATGVPSIVAASQEDLYFALGYVHAQDRLWQMERRRLQAAGRLAELLGEEALASDLLMRTLGLRQAAERDVARSSARTSGTLQAYSDGVNAFLATHDGPLPLEFQLLGHVPEEWTPVDVALLQKLTSWEWSSAAARELLRARVASAVGERAHDLLGEGGRTEALAFGDLPLTRLHRLVEESSGLAAASRGWVLGGDRAAEGAPLLAVELHGRLTAPSPWYLVRLSAPGLEVAGATLPGMPLLLSGQNEAIAWALVPTAVDDADLFLEAGGAPAREANGNDDRARAQQPRSRRETINVRGADDVQLVVREGAHGPVISGLVEEDEDADGRRPLLTLAWTGLREGDATLQAGLALAAAGDWQEFRNAVANLDELHGTALYADVEGRIGWHQVGRRPVRAESSLSASGVSGGWDGWVPFTELDGRLHPPGGERLIAGDEVAGTAELLASLGSHTVPSFASILVAEHLPGAELLLPLLKATIPDSEPARQAQAELVGWAGEARAAGAAPMTYSAWVGEVARELLADELGPQLAAELSRHPAILERALTDPGWCDDATTDVSESCAEVSSRALSRAVADLVERYGPRPDSWPPHPQASAVYRHPVFEDTLLARFFRVTGESGASCSESAAAGVATVATGPALRAVFSLTAERDSSGFLIPTGESGNPLSRHYRDLVARWDEVRLLPLVPRTAVDGPTLLLEPRR